MEIVIVGGHGMSAQPVVADLEEVAAAIESLLQ